MADARASRAAREPAVREQDYRLTEPHAGYGRRRRKHLTHARSAFWSFITNDDHMTRLDLASENGLHGLLLGVEYDGHALELHHLVADRGLFDDGPVRREIARKHGDAALFMIGLIERPDDVLVPHAACLSQCNDGFAAHGRRTLELALEPGQHAGNAACRIEVFEIVMAARQHIANMRRRSADLVERIHRQCYTCLVRYRGDVERCIRGAAEGHVDANGVLEGVLRHDLSRREILPYHAGDAFAALEGDSSLLARNGKRRGASRQAHAERLGDACHSVCRIHALAGAGPRAGADLELGEVGFRHLALPDLAHGLEGADQVNTASAIVP